MKKKIKYFCIAISLTLLTQTAFAWDCNSARHGFRTASDSWQGTDKLQHFGVSVPFGAMGAYIMRDTEHPVIYGSLIGLTPGLIKEVFDGTCQNNGFSYKDLTYDFLGSLTGALLGNYAINYYRDRHGSSIGISYSKTF